DQRHRLMGFARRHACGWLVEQKDLGIARERDAELELLLVAVGQRAGGRQRLFGETDRGEQRLGFAMTEPVRAGPEVRSLTAMSKKSCAHVLEHVELRKDIGALERAPEPHTADLVRRHAG